MYRPVWLVIFFGSLLFSGFSFAGLTCKRYEERRDCRPNPVIPGEQICALYRVCRI